MEFTDRYHKLNIHQKEAVDKIEGPVMVIAGPGTGKTELLSMRAANILQKTDTLPENILCLTFTESGATAMRSRLASIIGPDAYKVAIHTFHSFGTEVINQNSEFFYNGATFKPADDLSCYEIMRTIFDGLEYDNPLAAKNNDEYTHLGDTLTVISELKKSGLTSAELLLILDANDQAIDKIEPLLAKIFSRRISKSTIEELAAAVTHIKKFEVSIPLPGIVPFARICADSLEAAVSLAEDQANSTKPITAWRNAWLKKNDMGSFILKARERQIKLRSVSFVYYQYLVRMQEEELFDFDDMIMQVVHAMEVSPDLCFNLQERYLYIMVDEFQDTNLAQMRILYNLINSEVNAGRPNILVVGDDDQAIYSFQGANVGNINAFLQSFDQAVRITLTDNYRSAETILTHAREVITLGQNRLETSLEGIDKSLTPHYKATGAHVRLMEMPTIRDEREQLVSTIQSTIKQGTSPSSIAVIARRHHELMSLLPYFVDAGLPVNYERRDNVLDNELVRLIEHISCIIVALFEGRHDEANALLPELCAHPAFAMAPHDIWQLSLDAHKNHQTWLEVMAVKPQFMPLFTWLVTLSQNLPHNPLEIMIDQIVGLPVSQKGTDSEYDDANTMDNVDTEQPFVSPLFGYYFSDKKRADDPDEYLSFLEALRTIRMKLRDYQPNEIPTLQSFLEFIRLHRQLGSSITSVRPESERIENAVNLMTAHKSKGLEFDTVFITGAIDNAWGEHVRSRSRLIGYPENLPLAPAGDTLDERLRLFFVAMTRARRQLIISYSGNDDSGKATLRASFLTGSKWAPEAIESKASLDNIVRAAELAWYQPLVHPIGSSMREILMPQLEAYRLSSTHLNNFLDVSRGGPQSFLLGNLLRFPQAMSPHAAFGSAIHATLQRAQTHLLATGSLKPLEDMLRDFEELLRDCRLPARDFDIFLQKGSDALTAFTKSDDSLFTTTQKAELNFAGQAVQVGEARLTGSLDLVAINESDKTIIVTDYKTGKALRDWSGKTDYEKIKLHKYRQQLMFYNLLVRHSRDYSKYNFEKGILQFVEPTKSGEIIALETAFTTDELDEFSRLITAVWNHIMALEMPDTSSYEPSYKGMLAFEKDLLVD